MFQNSSERKSGKNKIVRNVENTHAAARINKCRVKKLIQ